MQAGESLPAGPFHGPAGAASMIRGTTDGLGVNNQGCPLTPLNSTPYKVEKLCRQELIAELEPQAGSYGPCHVRQEIDVAMPRAVGISSGPAPARRQPLW